VHQVKGILEVDATRGVIYFHSLKTGWTLLRICRLPPHLVEELRAGRLLDLAYKYNACQGSEPEKLHD